MIALVTEVLTLESDADVSYVSKLELGVCVLIVVTLSLLKTAMGSKKANQS